MFYNNNRIHYDKNTFTQTDMMNKKFVDYNLLNNNQEKRGAVNVLLNQPNINSFGLVSINEIVDSNSKLLLNKEQFSINKDKSTINEPEFYNKPYLGNGELDINTNTLLRNGEYMYHDKKYTTRLNENVEAINNRMPLLNKIEKSIANPSRFVEENVDNKWVRGGLPTRDLSKYA